MHTIQRIASAAHEPYRSELAVTAAASIANAIYEMGQQVGLITNGRDAVDRIRAEGWDYDIRSRDAARAAGEMVESSERLRPVTVPTRQGADQFLQIIETLARVELTDGLTLPQLLAETATQLPRDATVLVILPCVTPEFAIALANLKRQGYSVGAILNIYDEFDFVQASGPLLANGIATYHLRNEEAVGTVCRNWILR